MLQGCLPTDVTNLDESKQAIGSEKVGRILFRIQVDVMGEGEE